MLQKKKEKLMNQNQHKRCRYACVLLLVCVLLLSTVCSYADDYYNTVPNTEPGTTTIQTVDTEVLRISANDTTGLHSVVLQLIGDYNSVVKDYTYITTSYNGTQTTNHVVEITPDYSWLASCLLFIVMIYCLLRLLGSLMSGGKL